MDFADVDHNISHEKQTSPLKVSNKENSANAPILLELK